MTTISLKIDDRTIVAEKGQTILEAALGAEVYIPHLCWHPVLGHGSKAVSVPIVYQGDIKCEGKADVEYSGCGLCSVEIAGKTELVSSCDTIAQEGMVVFTATESTRRARQNSLRNILAHHPHACLMCAQAEGCSRTQCSSNVPEQERCCSLFGNCELQRLVHFIGIPMDLPKYVYQGKSVVQHDPLFEKNYNLCVGCLRCVRVCKDVRGVRALGFTSGTEGQPVVGYIDPDIRKRCQFCTACVHVCPTGSLVDKGMDSARYEQKLVPCKASCPASIDIPRYIRRVREEKYDDAVLTLLEKTPMPKTLGYVCFHVCEKVCRRGEVNEPVAICALKRFACEQASGSWRSQVRPNPSTGKKIAIIGSGPAGLCASYFLALKGYIVTIFEAQAEPGGMLRYGIPAYRLPREVLQEEIDFIKSLGVNIQAGHKIEDVSRLSQGFDAVLVAVGLSLPKRLRIDGADMPDVYLGLDFLKTVASGEFPGNFFSEKQIIVIGGGNVAVDTARTALRLGGRSIALYCLESRQEMPAHDWEIEDAIQEGIEIHTSWGPLKIRGKDGKVAGVDFVRCVSVFDTNHQFKPQFDNAVTMSVDADAVLIAIGQVPDLSSLEDSSVKRDHRNAIEVKEGTFETSRSGIFAAGDVVSGPQSVIEAIAAGRKAACTMDKYLGGDGQLDVFFQEPILTYEIGKEEDFAIQKRLAIPKMSVAERIEGFAPVECGYDRESALAEARRCLQCDLRLMLAEDILPPKKEKWLSLTESNLSVVPDTEGVYQLADEKKEVIAIKGTATLRAELGEKIHTGTKAKFFHFEQEPMYTKRETELIQQYLQAFGKMPGTGDDLDDLF